MKRRWLLLGAALLAVPTGAAQDGFTIVVARSNPASSIKRQEAARLFLKRTTRWADGSDVTPVDQSARSAVRLAFTRGVLKAEGMSAQSAVESYWQQQLFSGRGTPPPVKSNDAEVVAFVAANPGAIGYVRDDADVSAVKTVTLAD